MPGPEWLQRRRTAAAERAAATAFPTTDEEVWRYSRIADLDLDSFRPLAPTDPTAPADVPAGARTLLDAVGERAALVVIIDGRIVVSEVDPRLAAEGLEVGPLAAADDGDDLLGAVAGDAPDLFAELNEAFTVDPVLVRVPAGMVVPHPIVVVSWTATGDIAVAPRLVVQAGEDSEATVVDQHGSDDVHALTVPVVELDAAPASRLRYVHTQQLGYGMWQVGRQVSRVARDATFTTGMVAFGGEYARLRVESSLDGQGSTGDMLAVYFGEGTQMHDFRTLQRHVAPKTTSDLLFKGAVEDHARSVYTGLIRVEKNASGVNAFQTNRNIKLSPGAWAESVPNLEIENNDVRCSHASAVGPVDEEQVFYLQSRGVPPHTAERLVVTGFFDEVLERLPVPGFVAPLRAEIARKFARRAEG